MFAAGPTMQKRMQTWLTAVSMLQVCHEFTQSPVINLIPRRLRDQNKDGGEYSQQKAAVANGYHCLFGNGE
jgi:hypothetical protein